MENNLRTLGPQEARLVLSLQELNQEILTASEAIRMLGSESTGRKVLHNLVRKGWLARLKPGRGGPAFPPLSESGRKTAASRIRSSRDRSGS